ncbi:MAG: MBL fold metallo-hydrolase [Desulfobacteraceae bacterium]|jgi:glyoxylase-like metal-dependent hydrolase (beta-lactamase superfamily II)
MTDIIKPFPRLKNITPVPIPFNEVPYLLTANIYALGRDEITLIDAGPDIPGVMEFIKDSFIKEGLNFNNINRIILTHGHMDHFGLAARIKEELDQPPEILIHPEARWKISSEFCNNEVWVDEFKMLQKLTDIPDNDFKILVKKIRKYYSIATPLDDPKTMEDNDMFYGEGYSLQVVFSPGHEPGLCCLYEPDQKVLFSSDHIIKNLTPKPILAFNRDKLIDRNYKGLIAYEKSLERVSKLDVKYLFPGHGEWIEDMHPIIKQYRRQFSERMELVLNAVKKKEMPLYHLVRDVFPNVEAGDLFIALSEIISHLAVLVDQGRVEIKDQGPPVIYNAL